MATYYNGQEIKSTSKMSGLSLVGRTSVKIGGIDVNLSTRPRLERISLYFSGERVVDPETACSIGPGGEERFLFSDFPYANEGSFLFEDDEGTIPFDGKDSFYFDPQQNGVVIVDSNGMIGRLTDCGR